MNCDQIRSYLPEYVAGTLPRPKAAWVVQHMAGCAACTQAVASLKAAAPKPAERETAATAESSWADLRRPTPRWLWPAAVGLALLLVAAATWAVLRPASAGGTTGVPTVRSVAYEALPERKGNITLSVAQVVEEGQSLRVRLYFAGDHLLSPVAQVPNVYLEPADGSLTSVVYSVSARDDTGLQLDVRFDRALLQGSDQFSLRVGGIHQLTTVTATLPLPEPPAQVEPARGAQSISRGGLRLLSFGWAGDRLELQVTLGGSSGQTPTLTLRDAENVSYAPTFVRTVPTTTGQTLALEFPRPGQSHPPFTLVSQWSDDRYVGPWVIDIQMRE